MKAKFNMRRGFVKISKAVVVSAVYFSVTACSRTFYYREGGGMAAAERAKERCEARSLEIAPVAMMTTWEEECHWEEVCDRNGDCHEEEEYELESETEDVNKDLRNRLTNACMEDRGYERLDLPECPRKFGRPSRPAPPG